MVLGLVLNKCVCKVIDGFILSKTIKIMTRYDIKQKTSKSDIYEHGKRHGM